MIKLSKIILENINSWYKSLDGNIDDMLALSEYHIGKKTYFAGYINHPNNNIKPSLIKLPQTNGSIKYLKSKTYVNYG